MDCSRQLELAWQDDHRVARVRVLALMYLAFGISCQLYELTVTIPFPRPLPLPIIAFGLALTGVSVLIWGRWARPWLMQCLVGAFSLSIGLVAANSVIPVSVVGVGPAVFVAAMYIGAFCTTLATRIQVPLTVGSYLLGAVMSSAATPWVSVAVTAATALGVAGTLNGLTAQLRIRGATDALTGALNRITWTQITRRQIVGAGHHPVTIAMLDLDNFKAINDEQGHLAGDDLLQAAAQSWMTGLRDGEILGRFGGDEFVLLVPGATAEQARMRLQDLKQRHPVAWTAGVTQAYSGQDLAEVLAAADADLLSAKRLCPPWPSRQRLVSKDRHSRMSPPDWQPPPTPDQSIN